MLRKRVGNVNIAQKTSDRNFKRRGPSKSFHETIDNRENISYEISDSWMQRNVDVD